MPIEKKKDPEELEVKLYEKQVAVFIGINKYKTLKPLAGAVNDAIELRETFRQLEFDVEKEPVIDEKATKKGLEEFFDNLRKKLAPENEKEKKEFAESLVIIFFCRSWLYPSRRPAEDLLSLSL